MENRMNMAMASRFFDEHCIRRLPQIRQSVPGFVARVVAPGHPADDDILQKLRQIKGHFVKFSPALTKNLWYSSTTSDAKEAFGRQRRKTL
jgi:hypothetical protein